MSTSAEVIDSTYWMMWNAVYKDVRVSVQYTVSVSVRDAIDASTSDDVDDMVLLALEEEL